MDLMLSLEYDTSVPLFRRLSDALRKAIIEGRVKPGEALPSIRELSATLTISRSTVLRSFQDLQGQGYIESTRGMATSVVRSLPGDISILRRRVPKSQLLAAPPFSVFAQRMLINETLETIEEPHMIQSNYGGAPLNLVPLQQWKQLLTDHCRFKDLSRLAYSTDSFGYMPLRESLTAYLARSRAVHCTAGQVAIFAGRELRLDLICRLLLDEHDHVAVENPGFAQFRHRISPYGAKVVPIPVDRFGLDVSKLEQSGLRFKFVLVAPSHHEPLGITMSLERRHQLIDWARQTNTFLVEDDFDCEYRYCKHALPSLQGLDRDGLVIYMRCFWRILFPLMRLGFLVLPERLVDAVRQAKNKVERDPPLLEQFALTSFINEGHLERHIHRTQPVYSRRRQALIYALTKHFGQSISIYPSTSGLEILVKVNLPVTEQSVLEISERCGISFVRTSSYYLNCPKHLEFMVPFGHLSEESLENGVSAMAKELFNSATRSVSV